MLKKLLDGSFVRYVIVGVGSLAIDYGLLLAGYHTLGIGLAAATTAGFVAGLFANFLLNKFWAFHKTSHTVKHSAVQGVLYGSLVVFNLAFTNAFVLYLDRAGIGPEVSKLAATALITLWNFVLYKKVIFPVKTTQSEPTTPLS